MPSLHKIAFYTCLIAVFLCACVATQPQVKQTTPPEAKEPDTVEGKILAAVEKLSQDLIETLEKKRPGYKPRIAVVDFLGPGGNHTVLGRFLAEKLITQFVKANHFEKVLERHLLKKLLQQHTVEMAEYFNPDTVSSVTDKIGMEAIVTGVVTDLGNNILDINARIVDHRGEILGVAEAQIPSWGKEPLTASLTVFTNPPLSGLTVTVGERTIRTENGVAIFKGLQQGNRGLVVSGKGIDGIQRSVYLDDDKNITIPIALKKLDLTVSVIPRHATVLLDGTVRTVDQNGQAHIPELLYGEHRLVVKAEGYEEVDRKVELIESQNLEIRLQASFQEGQYDEVLQKLVALNNANPPFKIKIWTNQDSYRKGENLIFFFQAERDCYLTLIDISTDGDLSVIFPNKFHQDNFVSAGQTYQIPGDGYGGFQFQVFGSLGVEKVKAIATLKPLSLFDLKFDQSPFYTVAKGNARSVRAIVPVITALPDDSWSASVFEFTIK